LLNALSMIYGPNSGGNREIQLMKLEKFLAIFALLLVSSPSMAYIDPGSGSAIVSGIIGVFVAMGIAIKTYWYQLKGLLTRNQPEAETAAEEEAKQ